MGWGWGTSSYDLNKYVQHQSFKFIWCEIGCRFSLFGLRMSSILFWTKLCGCVIQYIKD